MSADQRQYTRYQVKAYADYAGSEVLLYHAIQNMSLGGICLQVPEVEPVGARVNVVMTFPDAGKELSLSGVVVWTNQTAPKELGIRWVDMTDVKRLELRACLAEACTQILSKARNR